ncbi:MAG: O-antigen ligase family protein [Gaiellaceae bacterium]
MSSIRSTAWIRRTAPTLPALLVGPTAFLSGGYYESTYSLLAAVVWLGIAIAASLLPLPLPSAATWLLLGLGGWTLLSALWGSPAAALRTAPLVALYAGVLLAAEWTGGPVQLRALRAVIVVAVLIGLVARAAGVAPVGGGQGSERLAWPVTYSNGLGLFAVYGVLLAAGLAAARPRLAAAAAAVCAAAAYLTFSRSALLVGAGAALLLLGRRPASARGLAGAALGVAAVACLDAVGRTGGARLVPAVALGALAAAALPRFAVRIPRTAAMVAGVAVAAAGTALAQPLAARFAAPAPDERNAHRLLDVSGHGRTTLWRVAWREGAAYPAQGGGAGTWPREAIEKIGPDAPANAHSLYLETFAELGVAGLALLAAALTLMLVRAREAAALALLLAFAVHAAVDWDWQLPAVTIPVLLGAGAGLRARRRQLPVALVPAAVAIGLAAGLHGIGAAIVESGVHTQSRARLAARLLPWDARPWAAVGDLRRACAADVKEPVLTRLHPSKGGCAPRR